MNVIYIKEIVWLHGLPDTIVSDCDSKFTPQFWSETHRLSKMHRVTEQVNKSIGQVICTMVQPNQRDWVSTIPMVEFALNSNISSLNGFAPFELNYGYMPTFIGGMIQLNQG